jgi:hypothetical protein
LFWVGGRIQEERKGGERYIQRERVKERERERETDRETERERRDGAVKP